MMRQDRMEEDARQKDLDTEYEVHCRGMSCLAKKLLSQCPQHDVFFDVCDAILGCLAG